MLIGCKKDTDGSSTKILIRCQKMIDLVKYVQKTGVTFTETEPFVKSTNPTEDNICVYAGWSANGSIGVENAFLYFDGIYSTQVKTKIDGDFYYFENGDEDVAKENSTHFRRSYLHVLGDGFDDNDKIINPVLAIRYEIVELPLIDESDLLSLGSDKSGVYNKLTLRFFMIPVDSMVVGGDFTIKFGVKDFATKYFNIYVNDVCIGTCYYNDNLNALTMNYYESYLQSFYVRG